jgi:hypothetical protein
MSFLPPKVQLKMSRAKVDTVSGIATILLKIPPGNRMVRGGACWFTNHHADDFVEVYVSDEDNLLGAGAGFIVNGYTEIALAGDNKGNYFEPDGKAHVEPISELGNLPTGLYLKIVATKGDLGADTLRVNINWGIEF